MIYVMSDIHGHMERFDSVLKQINLQPEDTLYILGDVVDRYPHGGRILRRIMQTPNMKMLLGNHEKMLLDSIADVGSEKPSDKYWRSQRKMLWYNNGGTFTHQYFNRIRKELRAEMIEYLNSLPLNIDVECNGTVYKLVHGSPVEYYSDGFHDRHRFRSREDYTLWNRWNIEMGVPDGYTLIFGHTPTVYFRDEIPPLIWKGDRAIGIDCGCGYEQGHLGCLRLDDMKEFYSEGE